MEAAGGGEARRQLPQTWRVTGGEEIRALFQRGKRSRTAHLDVFDSASPVSHPRAGVVVPRHQHTAVRRNRLKRQLREILRLEVLPRLARAQVHSDVLVRARREAYEAAYSVLRDELVLWVERRWRRESCAH